MSIACNYGSWFFTGQMAFLLSKLTASKHGRDLVRDRYMFNGLAYSARGAETEGTKLVGMDSSIFGSKTYIRENDMKNQITIINK